VVSSINASKTIYVESNAKDLGNGSEKNSFKKIQDAINKAEVESTIFVKKGIYKENIVINKKIILKGEEKTQTIIDGQDNDAVTVDSAQVTIEGFTIQNGNNGINLRSNGNKITENCLKHNNHGIFLRRVEDNIISNNEIEENIDGVIIIHSGYNSLNCNNIATNGIGILIHNAHYNTIFKNRVYDNLFGIELVFSSYNTIEENFIEKNGTRIKNGETVCIAGSGKNIVTHNKLVDNRFDKISTIRDRSINIIYDNEIKGKIQNRYLKNIEFLNSFGSWFSTGISPSNFIVMVPFHEFRDGLQNIKQIGKFLNDNIKNDKEYLKLINKTPTSGNIIKDTTKTIANAHPKKDEKLDLVIITPEEFSSKLKLLADHKNRFNVKTKIVCLEDIYKDKYFKVSGRDKPEQIKFFIKNCVENWSIKYVLLVGDIRKIPMRQTWSAGEENFLTDLYYADIYQKNGEFCSWDSNKNNYFGEFYHMGNTDDITLIPDVGIGRLPCRSSSELGIIIKKIIKYETETYDTEWFKRAVFCGGDDRPNYRVKAGEIVCDDAKKNISRDFITEKLYTSNNKLTVKNVIKEFNKGAGFFHFFGSGNEGMWYTYSSDAKKICKFNNLHNFICLQNGYKLPIVFLGACVTGNLNFMNRAFPCFAWSLVTNKNGGAIATIASTQLDVWIVEKNFFAGTALLSSEFCKAFKPGLFLSDVLMQAQKNYIKKIGKDYEILESFILIGDPTLMIGGYPL